MFKRLLSEVKEYKKYAIITPIMMVLEVGLWLVCASSNENSKVDFVTPKNPSIRPDVVESEDRMEIKVNVGTRMLEL